MADTVFTLLSGAAIVSVEDQPEDHLVLVPEANVAFGMDRDSQLFNGYTYSLSTTMSAADFYGGDAKAAVDSARLDLDMVVTQYTFDEIIAWAILADELASFQSKVVH